MSLKLGQIQPWIAELAAFDQLKKKYFTFLRTIQNILMSCLLSGERSLPFVLLVLCLFLVSFIFLFGFECKTFDVIVSSSGH